MKRQLLAIAVAAIGVVTVALAPQLAQAGGVNIAAGVCSVDGITLTWKHLDEAARDEASGVTRKIELLSVTTFEATPRVLAATEVSKGVWKIAPFSGVGTVVIDVALQETITAPSGVVVVERSTPRVSFTCTAPPPPPTTTLAPTTTAAAPLPTPAPTPAPTAAPAPPTSAASSGGVTPTPTIVLPVITVAGPTTTVSASLLPETGSSENALLLAGCFLILAGIGLSATARRRPV